VSPLKRVTNVNMWIKPMGLVAAITTLSLAEGQVSSVCSDYDFSKIKLVTFDCFAAMMAWEGNKNYQC
jgi:hypothetical protein